MVCAMAPASLGREQGPGNEAEDGGEQSQGHRLDHEDRGHLARRQAHCLEQPDLPALLERTGADKDSHHGEGHGEQHHGVHREDQLQWGGFLQREIALVLPRLYVDVPGGGADQHGVGYSARRSRVRES